MKVSEAAVGNRRIWVSISQCAWCRGIKLGRWYFRKPKPPLMVWREQVSLPHLPELVISMTHGACPQCAQRVNDAARSSRLRRRISDATLPAQKDNISA